MENRRLSVLQAIVEDYVSTREPVGSKALLERHDLGVSAATVRNDMVGLEEEGLIEQPHTSAGRVPTDKGYRVFVDAISQVKPLSAPERRAIETLLNRSSDLDDLLMRTVRMLADLTHQVALVQYPSLNQARVRRIELVPVAARHVLLVLITDSGRVDQRTIEVSGAVDGDAVSQLNERMNAVAVGRKVTELAADLTALPDGIAPEHRATAAEICQAVQEALDARREERIVLAGTANLARSRVDFADSIHGVLQAIEEQIVLLHLLSDISPHPGELFVRIGQEMEHRALASASLVGTAYGPGIATSAGGDFGSHLAVLGPTRMDYAGSMAAVRAVSRYVSRYVS